MVTPRPLIDSVVTSVCGRPVRHLVSLGGGGMNETYRAELSPDAAVVIRIARHSTPWFVDEARLMTRARAAGVPTAEVLGLEHLHHDDQLLSISIQQLLPGRALDSLVGTLSAADLERLVTDAGEALARIHALPVEEELGTHHELRYPDDREVSRVAQLVTEALGPRAALTVKEGADVLCHHLSTRPSPPREIVHGDFCPKNLLVHNGQISGVVDWEFAGTASAAYDFAHWMIDSGEPLQDRLDLVRRGYARVADPEAADAGWTPAFAIDWCLEKLGWKNPASPEQMRRCVEVIARYTGPGSSGP